jgi:hypothetical protein
MLTFECNCLDISFQFHSSSSDSSAMAHRFQVSTTIRKRNLKGTINTASSSCAGVGSGRWSCQPYQSCERLSASANFTSQPSSGPCMNMVIIDSGFNGVAGLYTNQLRQFDQDYRIEPYMKPKGDFISKPRSEPVFFFLFLFSSRNCALRIDRHILLPSVEPFL